MTSATLDSAHHKQAKVYICLCRRLLVMDVAVSGLYVLAGLWIVGITGSQLLIWRGVVKYDLQIW